LLDRYFRILSGNTQVNATEIRNLHFPTIEMLASIGQRVRTLPDMQPDVIERIIIEALGVTNPLVEHLAGETV
jgi:adenine-specific DNA-methyltransferase